MNSNVSGSGAAAEAEVNKTATFEHRDENKTCSACPEDQLLSDFQTFFYLFLFYLYFYRFLNLVVFLICFI